MIRRSCVASDGVLVANIYMYIYRERDDVSQVIHKKFMYMKGVVGGWSRCQGQGKGGEGRVLA